MAERLRLRDSESHFKISAGMINSSITRASTPSNVPCLESGPRHFPCSNIRTFHVLQFRGHAVAGLVAHDGPSTRKIPAHRSLLVGLPAGRGQASRTATIAMPQIDLLY